jgi:thiol-disulfide isomerase/thioredoxin
MDRVLLCCLFITFTVQVNSQKLLRKDTGPSDVTVIIFLAVDCPISQKYIPALNDIHEKYVDRGVKIHSVIPGKIKKNDIAKFKEEYGILFKVSADRRYDLVKTLAAEATPEVFVFDRQRKMKYRGAVDNWFYELGGHRKKATEDYLIDAIESLLAGREPQIGKTKALGCFIQISRQR